MGAGSWQEQSTGEGELFFLGPRDGVGEGQIKIGVLGKVIRASESSVDGSRAETVPWEAKSRLKGSVQTYPTMEIGLRKGEGWEQEPWSASPDSGA